MYTRSLRIELDPNTTIGTFIKEHRLLNQLTLIIGNFFRMLYRHSCWRWHWHLQILFYFIV